MGADMHARILPDQHQPGMPPITRQEGTDLFPSDPRLLATAQASMDGLSIKGDDVRIRVDGHLSAAVSGTLGSLAGRAGGILPDVPGGPVAALRDQPFIFPSFTTARPYRSSAQARSKAIVWNRKYARILAATDGIVVVAAALTGHVAWFGLASAPLNIGAFQTTYFIVSLVVALAWMVALHVYRSRDARITGLGTDEYKRVVNASLVLLGSLALASVVLQFDISRGYFGLVLPAGIGGLVCSRWLMRRWLQAQRRRGRYLSRVLVLGRPRDVRYVVHQISAKSRAAYSVVGVALTGKQKPWLEVNNQRLPVVCDENSVVDAVERVGVDAVIVAGPTKGGSRYVQELGWKLEESATQLILTTGLTTVAGPRIHSRPVEGLPLMHVELPQYSGGKHVLKRGLDIVLSTAALIALVPVFVLLAVLVRRDSPGPVIFRQERVGRGGKKFLMLKFRSMVETAEDDLASLLHRNEGAGLMFKIRSDPRITRVGAWMRRYSLDELPQFWNVLIGDMSLVGPRPPLQREVDKYPDRVHRRLYIKPGLTGMWQTNGRSNLSWRDSVRLDLYYVENWSLTGDLIILWRTAVQMFRPFGSF